MAALSTSVVEDRAEESRCSSGRLLPPQRSTPIRLMVGQQIKVEAPKKATSMERGMIWFIDFLEFIP